MEYRYLKPKRAITPSQRISSITRKILCAKLSIILEGLTALEKSLSKIQHLTVRTRDGFMRISDKLHPIRVAHALEDSALLTRICSKSRSEANGASGSGSYTWLNLTPCGVKQITRRRNQGSKCTTQCSWVSRRLKKLRKHLEMVSNYIRSLKNSQDYLTTPVRCYVSELDMEWAKPRCPKPSESR